MKLAVLIPTRDGGAFLRRAVLAHLAQLRALRLTDVEVVISDNSSGPGGREFARDLASSHPEVRLIEQSHPLATAEAHLFAAARAADTEWVWTFGDDDLPAPGALARVYDLVRRAEADLFIGNIRAFQAGSGAFFPGATPQGGIVAAERDVFGRTRDVVSEVGYQSVAACLSTLVFRREVFAASPFDAYSRLSPIYAHVAAFLDAFAERTAAFIAQPLVDYRFGATPPRHWQDFADAHGAPVNRPWTSGIMDHLELLLQRGRIDPEFPARVREHHPQHTFALWAHVLHRVIEDMETGAWAARGRTEGLAELDRIGRLFGAGAGPAPLELVEEVRTVWLQGEAAGDQDEGSRTARLAPVREALAPALLGFPTRLAAADYEPGEWIDLRREDSGRFLRCGFADPEPWGRWTVGSFAQIALRVRAAPSAPLTLEAEVSSLFDGSGSNRSAAPQLWVNDGPPLRLEETEATTLTYPVTRLGQAVDEVVVTVFVPQPKRRSDPPTDDPRALGVGLVRLRLVAA